MTHRTPLVSLALGLLVITSTFVLPGVANASTYYVAVNGNDSNPGSIGAPWGTIRTAVSRLRPGDTLYLRGGTYSGSAQVIDSQIATVPSGTSWSNPVTISGYPGESVRIMPPDGVAAVRLTSGAPRYIILQDFALDGSLAHDPIFDWSVGYIIDAPALIYVSSGTHHIRFQRLDIGNTMSHAIIWSPNDSGSEAYASYLELLDSRIHHIGNATGDSGHGGAGINNGYGIYTKTDENLIARNEWDSNTGIAINLYGNRNTIRDNNIHGNGTRGGPAPGINIGSGSYPGLSSDNLIYNNLIYANRAGVQIYTNSVGTGLYNNTIYGNQLEGLHLEYYGSVTIRNNIMYANGTNVRDFGGATVPVIDHNVTMDPSFVNAGGYDFRLQSTSPAIDAGTNVPEVTRDVVGTPRPAGGAFDIGAFESAQTMALQAPANLRVAAIR